MFKPTVTEAPKSKSFNGGNGGGEGDGRAPAPDPAMFGPPEDGTAPPPDAAMFGGGSDDSYPPPPDPEESRVQPIKTDTPKSESFSGPSEPGDGQPGDGVLSSRSASVHDGPMPQKQTVTNDRGGVTEFTSDVPLDRKGYGR